ncbi:DgyrCDS14975 [Dimorphilus gyrociliatus]|uniref:DgyrCDS14975 n=1 Tax=Dimorphilus gyrociliatus TaxID=2664684 RepID=A0A7I8WFJ3_9ANNE|nr:DgyrCDS14975 [Dimorphilus gyrociliatus]
MHRMKQTIELGLYKYLSSVYSKKMTANNSFRQYLPDNLTDDVEWIYNYTGHKQSNFIFNCHWSGRQCLPKHFTQTITDYGICFTFNSPSSLQQTQPLTVSESGMNSALSLLLNIEQYQYMPDPDNNVGVRIFLHNDHKRPLMSDLGFAVAAGMHTLIGIKRTETQSLGKPFGKCTQSKYNSHAECIDHCRLKRVSQICNCIPFEAKSILTDESFQSMRQCFLWENYGCVRTTWEKIKKDKMDCACSFPCKEITFAPSLSFSSISQFTVDKILSANLKGKQLLQWEYLNILEIGEKNLPSRSNLNSKLMNDFINKMIPMLKEFINTFKGVEIGDWIGVDFKKLYLASIDILEKKINKLINVLYSKRMEEMLVLFSEMINKNTLLKNNLFGPIQVQRNYLFKNMKDCLSLFNEGNLKSKFWISATENAKLLLGNSNKFDNFIDIKNFVKVDIFYKDISYLKIIQQEKFSFLSFLSEVGGFMGLVLGASLVTVIEFIDFFVYKSMQTLSNKRKKSVKELKLDARESAAI